MKKIMTLALAAGLALGMVSTADARQGCGRGEHRGPHGHCRLNRGDMGVMVGPHGGLIIGNFYAGRGYWDGHRYYHHRAWRGHGWRYW